MDNRYMILIVEDDQDIHEMIKALLFAHKYITESD